MRLLDEMSSLADGDLTVRATVTDDMTGAIADAVNFILSAPAMTGQMIALDGGQHLGWSHPGAVDIVE